MKTKFILLTIGCMLASILLQAQDIDRNWYVENGVHLGTNINIKNKIPQNLKLQIYNGGTIGSYIGVSKRRLSVRLQADYLFSPFNITYTHPTNNNNSYQLNYKTTLHTFKYSISSGILLPFSSNLHKVYFHLGMLVMHDFGAQAEDMEMSAHRTYYDPAINRSNKELQLLSRSKWENKALLSPILTLEYKTTILKLPFYVQASFTSNGFFYPLSHRYIQFYAFEHQNNTTQTIQTFNFRDRNEVRLALGIQLFNAKLSK